MILEFRPAKRKATPQLIAVSGVSGSGKTMSALRLASGLAGDGRVGMIDTENGRGEAYEDDPIIRQDLPNGYDYIRLDPKFTPARYIEAIEAAERAKLAVGIIDTMSHEWEGDGGCIEIAEMNPIKGQPNWAKAKLAHRPLVNKLLSSPIHWIICLRSREKVKYQKDARGKQQVVQLGVQPIAEKNFVFEMLVSLRIEEETHHAKPLKCPGMLAHLFPPETLVDASMGAAIRGWNEDGEAEDELAQLKREAKAAAHQGTQAYRLFWEETLAAKQRKVLAHLHEELKFDAEAADKEAEAVEAGDFALKGEPV